MDAWYLDLENNQLSNVYWDSFQTTNNSGVTGLSYDDDDGLACSELDVLQLINSAAMQIEQQFYNQVSMDFATKDFIQESKQNGESLPLAGGHPQPSSSSSSLLSLSDGSPEDSSLFFDQKKTTSSVPIVSIAKQGIRSAVFPGICNQNRSDEEAITRAMLAVISSTSAAASASASSFPSICLQTDEAKSSGAFKPYNKDLASRRELSKPNSCRQKMIKKSIEILKELESSMSEDRAKESSMRSNHLHHVLSERKRRQKLNESFHALRMLLPPGPKKDKASVLNKTKDCIKTLKTQISQLRQKNQTLEMQLPPDDVQIKQQMAGELCERITFQIIKPYASVLEVQEISIRIAVRVECDIIQLVLCALECLKEMKAISLVLVDTKIYSPQMKMFAVATITFEIKACDWDEMALKEAINRVVDGRAAHQGWR